nr:aldose reductase-related protein 1-like [Leptinotarsa decemlineata]
MAAKIFMDMPSGSKMPAIGLGTFQSVETELENALNAALEAGYRHIDTAFVYENEVVIGRVLKQWISSGKVKREELFITTKLPICGVHEDRVELFIKKSLENLQLDYIDLYLIHFPIGTNYVEGHSVTPPDQVKLEKSDHLAIWKKMEEQVEAGRAKNIGVSNFNENQIKKIIDSAKIKPACLQVELHLSLQQKELVDFCHRNGLVVVAYSPLGSPGFNTFLESLGQEAIPLPNLLQNPDVKRIAEKHKKASGQVMLRFLIQKNIVPIPKSVTASRIKENIEVFDFSLDSEDMKVLESLDVGERARIFDFNFFPLLKEHPEWPFKK